MRFNRAFDSQRAEALREMLNQSPRNFGKESSLWTLEMAAEVSFEEGLTEERVSAQTIPGLPWRGWGSDGGGLSSGSPPRIRSMREKKAARPADTPLGAQRRLGVGLRGRGLVESPGSAFAAQLQRKR